MVILLAMDEDNDKIDNHSPNFRTTNIEEKNCIESEKLIGINLQKSAMYHFFEEVEDIRKSINDIQNDVEYFGYMYSALLSLVTTDEDMKESIIDLTSSIRNKVRGVLMKLKEMRETNNQNNVEFKASSNYRIRNVQHSTLSKSLTNIMETYCRTQQEYLDMCKCKIVEQLEVAGRSMTNEELEDVLEQGQLPILTHRIVIDTMKSLQTLANIEESHADILRLKSMIIETSKMLSESLTLAGKDVDVEDTVAYQIEKQNEYQEYNEELNNSMEKPKNSSPLYKSKSRRKNFSICCCVLSVSSIIIGAVVLNIVLFKIVVSRTPLF